MAGALLMEPFPQPQICISYERERETETEWGRGEKDRKKGGGGREVCFHMVLACECDHKSVCVHKQMPDRCH